MENQIEIAGTNDAPQVSRAAIDDLLGDMEFLTNQLSNIARMPTEALLGNPVKVDSSGVKLWRRDVRAILTSFFMKHKDALNAVLPHDELEKLDPLSTRFSKAIDDFEIRADKIINALEQYEALFTGAVN